VFAFFQLACLDFAFKRYPEAFEKYGHCFNYYNAKGNKPLAKLCLKGGGDTMLQGGKPLDALKLYQQSIALSMQEKNMMTLQQGLQSAAQTSMDLGKIESASLRSLEIITGGLTKANIKSLATAKLPALETLKIYFGSSQYNATGGVKDVAPLLARTDFPKLKHLGLMNAEFTDELCSVLGKAPILRRLETLDLSMGTMSSAGVAALVAHKKAFGHLAELDVSKNWLDASDIRLLKGIAKKVVSDHQRDGDDADRYVSLGE